MKLRSSRFHVPPQQDVSKEAPVIRTGAAWQVGRALLLAAGVVCMAAQAGAAPKAKTTPTPSPTATSTPSPTATATPSPEPTAAPTPAAPPNYSGTQQSQYISTARDGFVAQRTAKSQPYLEAHKALDAAGGTSARGLKSKEDITARRDLIAKASAANDEYLAFVKTQEDTYRAELAKTPLVPGDIDGLVKEFAEKGNTPTLIKLRETDRDALKIGDDMLAMLDRKFGAWTVNDAGKISFKKPADAKAYGELISKLNAKAAEMQKLRVILTPTPSPSPSASPGATPASSPTGAPGAAPMASPAAAVSPAPVKP